MPGINVTDGDGDLQSFPEATTWHVDDRGQLHLKAGESPVATFAKDRWQGTGTADAVGPTIISADVGHEILQAVADIQRTLAEFKMAFTPLAVGREVSKAIHQTAGKRAAQR